jgi:hypothetical protein
MSTIELDAQKSGLVRSILNETDENVVTEWLHFFKFEPKRSRRKIGLLNGIMLFDEEGNGKITETEFLGE